MFRRRLGPLFVQFWQESHPPYAQQRSPQHLPPLRRSRRVAHLLVRIPHLIVLAHEVLSPPLGSDVLDKQLADMSLHEAANEARVPELRRDSEIFAAAHQGVGLAAFGRGRDAVGVEVLLFAAGEGDEAGIGVLVGLLCLHVHDSVLLPSTADKTVLSRHQLAGHDSLASRRQTPSSRTKSLVQYAPVLDLG
jgi:hypothetical protein